MIVTVVKTAEVILILFTLVTVGITAEATLILFTMVTVVRTAEVTGVIIERLQVAGAVQTLHSAGNNFVVIYCTVR